MIIAWYITIEIIQVRTRCVWSSTDRRSSSLISASLDIAAGSDAGHPAVLSTWSCTSTPCNVFIVLY
jgi:hypothetical protein